MGFASTPALPWPLERGTDWAISAAEGANTLLDFSAIDLYFLQAHLKIQAL